MWSTVTKNFVMMFEFKLPISKKRIDLENKKIGRYIKNNATNLTIQLKKPKLFIIEIVLKRMRKTRKSFGIV